MRRLRLFSAVAAFLLMLRVQEGVLQASHVYPLEVFTSNGSYYNSPALDSYVVVSEGVGGVDFTFYNESSIDSSLARIYFDDGSLLGIANVTSGPGTSFSQPANPSDLPNGGLLEPPFVTTEEFSIDGDPPLSHQGVNPVEPGNPLEWVRINFNLVSGGTLSSVIDELNNGTLRIGVHIIGLPDGSSESAVTLPAPEPMTISLLGLGMLGLLIKRRS
ncbi:MAG: PEP-CTERM sorting domain-containing protein [Planctomycetota bacterium]